MAKISFPRRRIRVVEKTAKWLEPIVIDPTLRRNIAYTFQFIDLVDWLLTETDIAFTAREQVIKFGIIAIHSILEAIIRDYLGRFKSIRISKKVKKNIKKIRDLPNDIKKELDYIHKKREKIHLHLWKEELEYQKYVDADYEHCKEGLLKFIKWIKNLR